ncbi:SHOCT domain-containing protein [Micrococcus luteus]|nr:SHOCT domain-containing protein [Micrococcus luteus]MCV7521166.1 SHOCT domain-containing protein [Micrococcus luteus]
MAGSGSPEFDKLKAHLDSTPAVRREVEFAFSALLTAANPSDRGLRFLFGNGAEWIIASAAWSAGVLVAPAGHNANGFDLGDLLDNARSLWSVKASASRTSSQIRLINFMGDGANSVWNEPTLFVGPYVNGAVLLDPIKDKNLQDKARKGSDALVLAGGIVKQYAQDHPENHVAFDVQVNEGAGGNDPYAFVKSVIDPAHFPVLSRPFVAAAPVTNNTNVDEIQRLVALRDSGALTEDQFQQALNGLLS